MLSLSSAITIGALVMIVTFIALDSVGIALLTGAITILVLKYTLLKRTATSKAKQ